MVAVEAAVEEEEVEDLEAAVTDLVIHFAMFSSL